MSRNVQWTDITCERNVQGRDNISESNIQGTDITMEWNVEGNAITCQRNVQGTDSCLKDGDHTDRHYITLHCLLSAQSSSQEPSKCLFHFNSLSSFLLNKI